YRLARGLDEKGDLEAAIRHFRQAVELSPHLDDARYALGNALLRARCPEEAVDQLQVLVERKPESPIWTYDLGAALHLSGRLSEAAAIYERVLKVDPRHAHAHNNLSQTLKALGRYED